MVSVTQSFAMVKLNIVQILLGVCLLGLSVALDNSRIARILNYKFENTGTGPYRFGFETSDGTSREEEGKLINEKTEDEALVVRGSYSYTGDDGVVYTVRYTADENGFHPEGDHIKVPPFVPWVKGQPHDNGHPHNHQHDDTHGEHLADDFINSPKSTSPIYLPSTPKPLVPQQTLINNNQVYRQPQPNQQLYLPSTPKPPVPVQYSNSGPVVISPQRQGIQNLINLAQLQNSKVYGPPAGVTPRNLELLPQDPRLRNSLLTLIPQINNGIINAEEVNSL